MFKTLIHFLILKILGKTMIAVFHLFKKFLKIIDYLFL